jgi:hypothetical protein
MTVISHKYKFIFIKTAKTGGTSVELLLNQICGEKDICSPVTKWNKWERGVIRPGEESQQPRNAKGLFCPRPCLHRPWRSGLGFRFKSEFREFIHGWKFRSHMSAIDIRARLGKKKWDEYYKFTIDRNPWDKAVSAYFFAQRNKKHEMLFEDWIQKNHPGVTIDFYSIDGKIAADRVIEYANLETELRETLHELGVNDIPNLTNAKGGFRPKNKNYREVHSDFTRDYVGRICAREIKAFNYKF